MMRLSARILEILDPSIERAPNSIFGDSGRLSIDYSRFKKGLHKIIKQDPIELLDFTATFITFAKNKYRKQIAKLRAYLHRLESGDYVSLKDLYAK